ncbi:zinc-binding dehydrogenase [Sphingomonas qilianensis]|uniref:Zinc-binding dehydrogenase n=1 Tax=Sphingomonas qilianensis TaxID=1736690 RepID=A0ABU9XQK8_9SPHN
MPDAMANLSPVPDGLTAEQVLPCPDILSTGVAQGPIGLCAAPDPRLMGADHVTDFEQVDPVSEILKLTRGRGFDVAIEALGRQATFEADGPHGPHRA